MLSTLASLNMGTSGVLLMLAHEALLRNGERTGEDAAFSGRGWASPDIRGERPSALPSKAVDLGLRSGDLDRLEAFDSTPGEGPRSVTWSSWDCHRSVGCSVPGAEIRFWRDRLDAMFALLAPDCESSADSGARKCPTVGEPGNPAPPPALGDLRPRLSSLDCMLAVLAGLGDKSAVMGSDWAMWWSTLRKKRIWTGVECCRSE